MKTIRQFTIILFMALLTGTAFGQYAQLYVIGDACPVGWDLPNAIPMVVDGTDATIFTWKGPLTASEIKFATDITDWCNGDEITATTQGASSTATDYQIRAGAAGTCTGDDNKWMVDAAGIYLITINLTAQTIAFELQGQYTQLYVIGDACPVHWDLPKAIPMKVDGTDATIFTWKGPLTASEIKFATNITDWDMGDEITATTQGASTTATDYQIRPCANGTSYGADNKWMVDAAGIYLITINLTAQTISFELQAQYTQLYVIGDACPVGWNLPNAIPMVVDGTDATIFTWTGPLTASEIKFSTNITGWDQGDEITATTQGASTTSTDYQIRPCANGTSYGPDNKWMVDAAGTYLITINLTAQTISFELQTGIKEADAFSNVSVYPNPASDILKVEVGQNTGASISLFSIDGRRLYSEVAAKSTTSIDMNRINASGVVIVKVENENFSKVFRVVVK